MPFPSDFHPTPDFRDWISWCVSPENPDAPVEVPAWVREVCGTCRGKGTTWLGRPSNDAVWFGADEWNDLHPDEQDEWMDGTYDQPCPLCDGQRVLDVPTPEGTPTAVWEAWEAHEREEWEHRAEVRAEMRAGC